MNFDIRHFLFEVRYSKKSRRLHDIMLRFFIFTTMHIIAETQRLVIREFAEDELNIYLKHFDDEEVLRYIPKRAREERIGIFHAALENYRTTKFLGIWGFFSKTTGTMTGSCLLRIFDNDPTQIEVGYSMDREYWGQGIGTEMALAIVAHAFSDPEVKEVVGVTDIANIGSQRVLEKAGLIKQPNIIRHGDELAYFKMVRK